MVTRRGWVALTLVVVAAGALVAGAAVGWRWWSTPADLTPEPAVGVGTWPADRAWAWTFRLPPGPAGVSLTFRRRSTPTTGNGLSPGVVTSAMSAADADGQFGTGTLTTSAKVAAAVKTGTVSLQLLDLADIGAVSARPGQTLRLLGRIAAGGAESHLSDNKIFLPPGRLAGWAVSSPGEQWAGDELYLMSFYVDQGAAMVRYDAVLVRRPIP